MCGAGKADELGGEQDLQQLWGLLQSKARLRLCTCGFSIPEDGPSVGSHPIHAEDPCPCGAATGLTLHVSTQGWWHVGSRGGEHHFGAITEVWGVGSRRGVRPASQPFPKSSSQAASGETVGACCERSFRTSSEDASQAFPIAGKSSSAVEKLPRCFLFI